MLTCVRVTFCRMLDNGRNGGPHTPSRKPRICPGEGDPKSPCDQAADDPRTAGTDTEELIELVLILILKFCAFI